MIAEELQQQIGELGQRYWEGRTNFLIRYWTYLDRGLDVFNKFKYYIGFPIATAAIFPFMKGHMFWLIGLVIIGLPILIAIGRYQLHKVAKTTEYVNAISGSIFQFKPMELSIEQVNLLKEILKQLQGGNLENAKVPKMSNEA